MQNYLDKGIEGFNTGLDTGIDIFDGMPRANRERWKTYVRASEENRRAALRRVGASVQKAID